jgi:hypothetical protein
MNHSTLIRLYIYKKRAHLYLRLVRQIMRDCQDEKAIKAMNQLMWKHEEISLMLNNITNSRLKNDQKGKAFNFRKYFKQYAA